VKKLYGALCLIVGALFIFIAAHCIFVWELIFGEKKEEKGLSTSDWVRAIWGGIFELLFRGKK